MSASAPPVPAPADPSRDGSARARDSAPAREPRAPGGIGSWLGPLLLRLHFWAAIVVGPFILVAALTGAAYALAPTLEQVVYADELTAPGTGPALPLADQVEAAERVVGDGGELVAVRPAPEPGDTTRVLFSGDDLIESQTRAIFVDPATAEIRGDLPVYGTSGSLPLRTTISDLHRSLGLGDVGRLYSELAASWLGVVVLAGLGLWIARRLRARGPGQARARARRDLVRPDLHATGLRRLFSWHASVGVVLTVGALFLSATGITWSQHAGDNVTALRAALSWTAPTLDTALPAEGTSAGTGTTGGAASDAAGVAADPHAGHHGAAAPGVSGVDPALFDDVLAVARTVNVDTGLVEIKPPADADSTWTVTEIKRSWPTQVDSTAVDGATLAVVDRTDFADHPLMAKLARWGVDTHMGTMFGLPNQLLLVVTALGVAAMVVFGYLMWWRRGPAGGAGRLRAGRPAPAGALVRAPWQGLVAVVAVGLVVGLFLPMVGLGLVLFIVVDALVTAARTRA
ncbi:PepSY domain-containing protein [Frigoribacterium sp. CFBP 13729]|uniref:PepSY-associated TM helix domain-containing protein n=1 Tax=Frigoribacterium sp. CFBP 13729 TaxID=2775293 RepID=UPI00177B14D5|nr:PepSY-associated TM helix domain-containing protein [Frigoribacterium sp. CFBP 13729]MBD8611655.1 PepSY domain-containing protein [Frigoribacterium sp. CFBP 13729]